MFAPFVAFTAALVLMLSGAFAQPYVYEQGRSPRYQRPAQNVEMNARLDVGRCYSWCPEDHTPCDPANFKMADGPRRCHGLQPVKLPPGRMR